MNTVCIVLAVAGGVAIVGTAYLVFGGWLIKNDR
jgi:hypothetical protein